MRREISQSRVAGKRQAHSQNHNLIELMALRKIDSSFEIYCMTWWQRAFSVRLRVILVKPQKKMKLNLLTQLLGQYESSSGKNWA
jgi:hypothetical protein